MDQAGARQEMVHARAVDDGGLRNRSSSRRCLPHPHAFARRTGILERRLLSRNCRKRKARLDGALAPGYRPASERLDIPSFTAVIALEPQGSGTKYTALAMHSDEEGRKIHEEMGFHEGWGKALDQLVACAKSM